VSVVVVIPTHARVEMLALTLEALANVNICADTEALDVNIYADTGANLEDIDWVRDHYYPDATIFHAPEHIQAPSGCWNILNAIKQGYETGAERIILLEEDVLPLPGFLEFHLAQTELASCGRWVRFNDIYGPLYTNPGSCLSRELVEQLIPHICDEYFTGLRSYLDRHFGSWDTQSELDDGLIRRVIRQMGGKAVYPDTPVARHIGFRFYNKLDLYMNLEETIPEKIIRLREIISKIRLGDRYATDFEF
jgi:hypothetical protein